MTVPLEWFVDGEAELLVIVRSFIPPFGCPTTTQKFRAKMALQKWMASKLEARYKEFYIADTGMRAP